VENANNAWKPGKANNSPENKGGGKREKWLEFRCKKGGVGQGTKGVKRRLNAGDRNENSGTAQCQATAGRKRDRPTDQRRDFLEQKERKNASANGERSGGGLDATVHVKRKKNKKE